MVLWTKNHTNGNLNKRANYRVLGDGYRELFTLDHRGAALNKVTAAVHLCSDLHCSVQPNWTLRWHAMPTARNAHRAMRSFNEQRQGAKDTPVQPSDYDDSINICCSLPVAASTRRSKNLNCAAMKHERNCHRSPEIHASFQGWHRTVHFLKIRQKRIDALCINSAMVAIYEQTASTCSQLLRLVVN